MREIKIGNIVIGAGHTILVAEAGVNHDCIIDRGKQLIESAKQAGADAIKFQSYKADKLTSVHATKYWTNDNESQYDNYAKLDKFNEEEHRVLKEHADRVGIVFFSTPFDAKSADMLERIGTPAYKIASADITNTPLIGHVAKKGLPVMLSTGAASIAEIDDAVNTIESSGNSDIILLHCILCYPTPPEHANLLMIKRLQKIFPKYPIGLSDHTTGIQTPPLAVALGAKIIEKHYTIDKNISGSSDHPISADPDDMFKIVESIRLAETMLGSELLSRPLEIENPAHRLARRSLVAAVDIPKGSRITEDMLIEKRPGTGIYPKYKKIVIGRTARMDIKKDDVITWDAI